MARHPTHPPQHHSLCPPPGGRSASACISWFDPVNWVGLFELVRTHPNCRGKGLGKAVMAEGLWRMKAAGQRWLRPHQWGRTGVGYVPGFQASFYFAKRARS